MKEKEKYELLKELINISNTNIEDLLINKIKFGDILKDFRYNKGIKPPKNMRTKTTLNFDFDKALSINLKEIEKKQKKIKTHKPSITMNLANIKILKKEKIEGNLNDKKKNLADDFLIKTRKNFKT